MIFNIIQLLSIIFVSAEQWPKPECNGTRVPPSQRRFNSTSVDAMINSWKPHFISSNISKLFENCLPNCLDTTIVHTSGDEDTFVITGDINAMWLRDSTNQLSPYVPMAKRDPALKRMICGAIRRQTRLVLTNRYANAFNMNPTGDGHRDEIHTKPFVNWCDSGNVYESKYELDSLIHVLKLSNAYFRSTGDINCFLPTLKSKNTWILAVEAILDTIKVQQAGTDEDFDNPAYTFNRQTDVASDTLINKGRGVPAKRCGLSKSYFRGSDDATRLPFNIPANAFAVVELTRAVTLIEALGNSSLAKAASLLAQEINESIQIHGVIPGPQGSYYTYEVDGYGSNYFMDDANIPGLLSLPYLGYLENDNPVYLRTREMVLSNRNPWFFRGSAGEGVGGPHQGTSMVWPMAIIMRALTSTNEDEIVECLKMLATTHADMFYMHESFHRNDARQFTRPWFSWANSLFGELIIKLAEERPHLIFKSEWLERKF